MNYYELLGISQRYIDALFRTKDPKVLSTFDKALTEAYHQALRDNPSQREAIEAAYDALARPKTREIYNAQFMLTDGALVPASGVVTAVKAPEMGATRHSRVEVNIHSPEERVRLIASGFYKKIFADAEALIGHLARTNQEEAFDTLRGLNTELPQRIKTIAQLSTIIFNQKQEAQAYLIEQMGAKLPELITSPRDLILLLSNVNDDSVKEQIYRTTYEKSSTLTWTPKQIETLKHLIPALNTASPREETKAAAHVTTSTTAEPATLSVKERAAAIRAKLMGGDKPEEVSPPVTTVGGHKGR